MSDALDAILAQAGSGEPTSQYRAGNVYHMGLLETPRNPMKAKHWYEKAAAQGLLDAQVNLGILLIQELGDPVGARGWFEKAVAQGDGQAAFYLGRIVMGEDSARAALLYAQADEAGIAAAANALGVLHMEGRSVEKSIEKAVALYRKAVEADTVEALFNLGLCFYQGQGVDQSYDEAFVLFKRAAKAGHGGAMHNLGAMFLSGQGIEKDETIAHGWFLKAADKNEPAAQYEAAQGLRLGRSIPQDLERAIFFYKSAAEQEFRDAQFSLALMLAEGNGLERPMPEEAEPWYQKAAINGHGGAAHNLGVLFAKGRGVKTDINKALELFEVAVSLGDDDALFSAGLALATMDPPELVKAATYARLSMERVSDGQGLELLEKLAPMMTDAQQEEAKSAARAWQRPNKGQKA
ncbi:MAG: hypothetical protein COB53_02660 [Elusimicrobia bacterium]|nr:MAG: hypothetical protein COB53_02660 [Elusimicrobiota bacterium]